MEQLLFGCDTRNRVKPNHTHSKTSKQLNLHEKAHFLFYKREALFAHRATFKSTQLQTQYHSGTLCTLCVCMCVCVCVRIGMNKFMYSFILLSLFPLYHLVPLLTVSSSRISHSYSIYPMLMVENCTLSTKTQPIARTSSQRGENVRTLKPNPNRAGQRAHSLSTPNLQTISTASP